MAQLPLYHSTSGKLQYGANRRSFSFRDRHLLLIILVVFAIICLGSLYYAPEVMEQVSFDVTYRKFIGLQDETNVIVADDTVMDDQVAPSKLPPNNEKIDDVVVHNDPAGAVDVHQDTGDLQQNEDVRRNLDEQKEQIEPKEQIESKESKEQSAPVNVEGDDHTKEEMVKQPDSKDLVNIENRNSDPVVTQRREKVKEVCMLCKYVYGA